MIFELTKVKHTYFHMMKDSWRKKKASFMQRKDAIWWNVNISEERCFSSDKYLSQLLEIPEEDWNKRISIGARRSMGRGSCKERQIVVIIIQHTMKTRTCIHDKTKDHDLGGGPQTVSVGVSNLTTVYMYLRHWRKWDSRTIIKLQPRDSIYRLIKASDKLYFEPTVEDVLAFIIRNH